MPNESNEMCQTCGKAPALSTEHECGPCDKKSSGDEPTSSGLDIVHEVADTAQPRADA